MHRLVLAGYARPGQSSWQLLDSFALDVLLDFAYGLMVEAAGPEGREDLEQRLAQIEAAAEPKSVTIVREDGSTVHISESRLAELQARMARAVSA